MSTSRPYKVTIKESYEAVHVADDSISTTLDIPPILPPARTAAVLKEVLDKRGYREEDGKMVRENSGAKIEIDPGTGGVTVSTHGSDDVSLDAEADSPSGGCGCVERAREAVREGLRKRLSREADERGRELQERVTAELEAAASKVGCELERISHHVAQEALKEKAASMGEVTSVVHDKGGMTITVKV